MSARPGSADELLALHGKIAVDSNVLIYLSEASGARADAAATIVDAVQDGRIEGSLSVIGLSEVLVGPARADDGAGFERLAATMRDLGFRILDVDLTIAEDAAWIRGRTGLSLPDAIHVATALSATASVLVTNDRRIHPQAHLDVVYLDDLVTGAA